VGRLAHLGIERRQADRPICDAWSVTPRVMESRRTNLQFRYTSYEFVSTRHCIAICRWHHYESATRLVDAGPHYRCGRRPSGSRSSVCTPLALKSCRPRRRLRSPPKCPRLGGSITTTRHQSSAASQPPRSPCGHWTRECRLSCEFLLGRAASSRGRGWSWASRHRNQGADRQVRRDDHATPESVTVSVAGRGDGSTATLVVSGHHRAHLLMRVHAAALMTQRSSA
jgi:hypothetical protein